MHEKAILMILIPLTPLALFSTEDSRVFLLLSSVGTFSLFPLLFEAGETPTKLLLLLSYFVYALAGLSEIHRLRTAADARPTRLMRPLEWLYLFGLIALQLYYSVGHRLLGLEARLPFLPLMLISVYSSVGVIYTWLVFYRKTLLD